jgi:hypothetical protein
MAYRMGPYVEYLPVKDRNGIIWAHYPHPPGGVHRGRVRGPVIEWIGEEYRERWLALGLVVEIDDAEAAPLLQARPAAPPPELIPEVNLELVEECIAALDRFGVAADAGSPTARKALRDKGQAWGNDTIAAAVRQRKMHAAKLAGAV